MQTIGVMSKQPGYASLCTECGKCERHCPQKIQIRSELKTVKKEMEGVLFKPVVYVARKILKIK
jgi:predicted aldo/keto reductase-like oxidoreductase